DSVFGERAGGAQRDLMTEGRYRELDGDGVWWIPSGRQIFDAGSFYLPVASITPFDAVFHQRYDEPYKLHVVETEDPLHNVARARIDYRTLSPWEITDPNGNRAQVAFDALGMVVATAVMGKVGEALGDTPADPTTRLEYTFASEGQPSVVHTLARVE